MSKRHLILFMTLFIATCAFAQQEDEDGVLSIASQLIQDAQALYDEGKVQEISSVFIQIMNSNPTRTEEVQARRLLTLSYLYLDEPLQSDQGMLDLLKTDPEFILQEEVEPSEFINLWYSFRTKPIFAVGLKGSLNATFVNVQEKFSTMSLNDYNGKYSLKPGFGGGITFEKTFNRWTVNPELNLAVRSISRQEKGNTGNGSLFNDVVFQENQQWLELPIMVQFQILNKDLLDPRYRNGFNPYAYLGLKGGYLLAAATTNTSRTTDDFQEFRNGINRTNDNYRWNYSVVAGAGIKYFVYKGFINADIRFDYGLSDISKRYNSSEAPDIPFGIGFANDRVRHNLLSVNIGYVKLFYSPKKKN